MKKIVMILLVFVLTACVTTTPTKTPAPATEVPTVEEATTEPTAEPTATEVSATETPAEEPEATEPATAGENSFGEIVFENRKNGDMVSGSGEFSANAFSLNCTSVPNQITFTVTVNDADIYKVNYLYRLTAIDTPLIDSGWSADAKMTALGGGKFSVDFLPSQISNKYRGWKAWFDVQFLAFDNQDVIYTSPIFPRLITYTSDCP
jgi:hypothetical protein